jgi:hypothetical protein
MKKLFLVSLMAMLAGPALAEWVKIGYSDLGTLYIDPATIRKDGNLRKIWVMTDLDRRDKDGEMSSRSRQEFDCKGERSRILSGSTHSEPMASGRTLRRVEFDNLDKWSQIPPSSIAEAILERVCAN